MPLIIDGHNLIPKIPGLSLEEADDEVQLIQLLQEFSRVRRAQVECYFDKAPQGYDRARRFGTVVAKFARPGKTADDEIRGRLERLGRAAKNYTVVSSDLQVQSAARAHGARFLAADAFARELAQVMRNAVHPTDREATPELSADEIEHWLREFSRHERRD